MEETLIIYKFGFIWHNNKVKGMVLSTGEKIGFTISLALAIVLVSLHMAVVGEGHKFADDFDRQNGGGGFTGAALKEAQQRMAFVIIAALVTLFVSIALLVDLYSNVLALSHRTKVILTAVNLIFEFAIAVVISLIASENANYRDIDPQRVQKTLNFLDYYRLSIADAVFTFLLQIPSLSYIFVRTIDDSDSGAMNGPAIGEAPLSNRQF